MSTHSLKSRLHDKRGMEYSLLALLIFLLRLDFKHGKTIRLKETKNALFHARSGNEP